MNDDDDLDAMPDEHGPEVDLAKDIGNPNALKGKHRQYWEAHRRRDRVLENLRKGMGVREALEIVDDDGNPLSVKRDTYNAWRRRYPQWAFMCDAARVKSPTELTRTYKQGFAEFRRAYFGMDSPWFHLQIIDALENSPSGSITLVLIPPRHGKTTLLEDYCNYKLAIDPTFRIGYGSERSEHAEKVLGRVRNRMERDGPCPAYVEQFGPFAPQTGKNKDDERSSIQPWGTKKFNVYKKGSHDERDYSMTAAGIMGSIQGSRFDLLILDDMQGTKNANLSETILEKLRQDWFTRPGPEDRIVIIGTRVGDDDIYQALLDAEDETTGKPLLDQVIIHPAIDHEGNYLWPEVYDPDAYERMRRRVGHVAWERNFLQRPRIAGQASFTPEIVDGASDPLWAWENPVPDDVLELAATIDPALGGQNAITVQGWGKEKMRLLDSSGLWGLVRTEQIISELANLLAFWNGRKTSSGREVRFTHVVIEEMAFQRGLPNDDRLKELQKQYGFYIVPHQTGHNKNDEIIGVTAMALSMMRGEIVMPGAKDMTTIARIQPVKDELIKWRPRKRGTRLKQDRVMALWFGWLQWRMRRETLTGGSPAKVEVGGLPFRPMVRPTMPNLGSLMKAGR